MKGYVARKGNRWYAVIYEGTDPITGRERRSWHPAGCERGDAERLAARLAYERDGANEQARALSFGVFLTSRWLPGKRLVLAASTYSGYRRYIEGRIVPALGRIGLRRLRPHHLEALYDGLLHPPRRPRRACTQDGVRDPPDHPRRTRRRRPPRAHLPQRRPRGPRPTAAVYPQGRTVFLDRRRAPRLPPSRRRTPALPGSVGRGVHRHAPRRAPRTAMGGLRRGGGYRLGQPGAYRHRLRGARDPGQDRQRPQAHRPGPHHGFRPHRLARLAARRTARRRDRWGGVDVHRRQRRAHPPPRHLADLRAHRPARRRAGHPAHDLRHTHGTLLIAAGVLVKVVSERLGHATPAFTIETYQHVLPGMQAQAARVFEQMVAPATPPAGQSSEKSEKTREKRREKTF
jgi:integrase